MRQSRHPSALLSQSQVSRPGPVAVFRISGSPRPLGHASRSLPLLLPQQGAYRTSTGTTTLFLGAPTMHDASVTSANSTLPRVGNGNTVFVGTPVYTLDTTVLPHATARSPKGSKRRAVWNFVKSLFTRNNSSPSQSITANRTVKAMQTSRFGFRAFVKSILFGKEKGTDLTSVVGILRTVRRTIRRHLLNWDREPHWINPRKDDGSDAAFARSTVRVRDFFAFAAQSSPNGDEIAEASGIRGFVKRLWSRLPSLRARDSEIQDLLYSSAVSAQKMQSQQSQSKRSNKRLSELANARAGANSDQLRVLGKLRRSSVVSNPSLEFDTKIDAAPLGDLQRVVARLLDPAVSAGIADGFKQTQMRRNSNSNENNDKDNNSKNNNNVGSAVASALRTLQTVSFNPLVALRSKVGSFFLEEPPVAVPTEVGLQLRLPDAINSSRLDSFVGNASLTAQFIESRRLELLQAVTTSVSESSSGSMRAVGEAGAYVYASTGSGLGSLAAAGKDVLQGWGQALSSALNSRFKNNSNSGTSGNGNSNGNGNGDKKDIDVHSLIVRQLSPRDVAQVLRSVGLPVPSIPIPVPLQIKEEAGRRLGLSVRLAELFPLSSAVLGFIRQSNATDSSTVVAAASSRDSDTATVTGTVSSGMSESGSEPIGQAEVSATVTAQLLSWLPAISQTPVSSQSQSQDRFASAEWRQRASRTVLRAVPGLKLLAVQGSRIARSWTNRNSNSNSENASTDQHVAIADALDSLGRSAASRVPFPLITESFRNISAFDNINGINSNEQIPNSRLKAPLSSSMAAVSAISADTAAGSMANITSLKLDETFAVKMGSAVDLRQRPEFAGSDLGVPVPTKADFAYIQSRRVALAVNAAYAVKSLGDAQEFMRYVGISAPLMAVTQPQVLDDPSLRVTAIKGVCRLIREDTSIVRSVLRSVGFVDALCQVIEAPRARAFFVSSAERERQLIAQREAMALLQRIVRTASAADIEGVRQNARLRKLLSACMESAEPTPASVPVTPVSQSSSTTPSTTAKKRGNHTNVVVDRPNLAVHEMARVAAWGLGGVPWKARQPATQRGVRVLSFDGGGTRGVLSIALLKELMKRSGLDPATTRPCEHFDVICGTSTGGIIAGLLGLKGCTIAEAEVMYDSLIDKVFGQKSNLKLVTEQAFYDEVAFEKVLHDICGDDLMVDSNRFDCPRVFCVSTRVNNNPPVAHLWRNYNYPPGQGQGQQSRYEGCSNVNIVTAIRATTAAPTFFTPVQWEGGLYCDGALVANNPTAIAMQEIKVLYPNVPIEFVVSVGTGFINQGSSNLQSMGWDVLVNNLIASSTDTEDIHALLVDFLPKDKYFRLNLSLKDNLAIDEKNKSVLTELKRLASAAWLDIDGGKDREKFDVLIKALRVAK